MLWPWADPWSGATSYDVGTADNRRGGARIVGDATRRHPAENGGMARKTPAAPAGGNAGVSDANGAPEIDGVSISLSAADLGDLLLVMGSRVQQDRLHAATQNLQTTRLQLAENHRVNIEKIEEYARKFAESNDKSQSVCNWIAKAFTFLAALIAVAVTAVATVASGGAASPALVIACGAGSSDDVHGQRDQPGVRWATA